MTIMATDRYAFQTLGELRDWLNQFKETDLDTIHPDGGDTFVLDWTTKALTDGSEVTDVYLKTV